MGELSDMMGRFGAEAQQAARLERQRAAEREADQRKSNQRAAEFVQEARRRGIPTLPLFAQHIEFEGKNDPRIFGYKNSRHLGYVPLGRGWLVREPGTDPEIIRPGLFLAEDLKVYESTGRIDRPEGVTPPETPYVQAHQSLIVGKEDKFPVTNEYAFAHDDGLHVLAAALHCHVSGGNQ